MPTKFASGRWAISQCDRCGFRYKLKELRQLVIKTKNVNLLVCPTCWEPDQPQLSLGLYPVNDPQALRNPRPDTTYTQAGYTGLQIETGTGSDVDQTGDPSGGSRIIEWGWYPVGGSRANDAGLTPNALVATTYVGTVTTS
jgi:hypothetical protein